MGSGAVVELVSMAVGIGVIGHCDDALVSCCGGRMPQAHEKSRFLLTCLNPNADYIFYFFICVCVCVCVCVSFFGF